MSHVVDSLGFDSIRAAFLTVGDAFSSNQIMSIIIAVLSFGHYHINSTHDTILGQVMWSVSISALWLQEEESGTDNSAPVKEKAFYSSDEESDSDEDAPKKPVYVMDTDHRLLLRSAKPLLNSRNSAVIMAVVQLYYHCAPKVDTDYSLT